MLALLAVGATVVGHVEAAHARWTADGNSIVTEARVRAEDGSVATVVQLGGSVGGLGMWFTHLPEVVQAGDQVELRVAEGTRPLVVSARIARAQPATTGVGAYGLRRTTQGGRPLHRATACLVFTYDAAGTAAIPGQLELAALDLAFATWMSATSSCGALSFTRDIAANLPDVRDGLDTIHFRDDTWCLPAAAGDPEMCYPPEAAAVTRVLFVDDPTSADDGMILETDMDINAVYFAPQVDGATTSAAGIPIDLVSVATHEVGHTLGLAHDCDDGNGAWPADADGQPVPSCDTADPLHVAATMYFMVPSSDTSKRTLEASDVDAACVVVGDLSCQPTVTGGCSAGDARSPLAALAALAVLALARRRRR